MHNDLSQYIKLILSPEDPIVYSILLVVVILALIFIFYKYIVLPLQKKHLMETHTLELANARLMSLFAELDPDPVIRTDINGKIIYTNGPAKHLIEGRDLNGKLINVIVRGIDFPIIDFINSDKSKSFMDTINSKSYSITFKGISSLKIAQVYFHDITDKIEKEIKLKKLSDDLQNKIEEDRHRIAMELHDGIGQELLLLKMDLSSNYKDKYQSDRENQEVKNYVESLQKIITELNLVIFNIKPAALRETGLGTALSTMVNKISSAGYIKGSLNIIGLNGSLNDKLQLAIYRIVQEALNNIVKHSGAKEFSVQLINRNRAIKILILDNGKGISKDISELTTMWKDTAGFGLFNIRERVEHFNGIFKIDSSEKNGTLLVIELPTL